MRFTWLPRIKPYWAEKSSGALLGAIKAAQADTPDIYHLHSVVAGSIAPLLRHKGAPSVVQMHGIEWMRGRWGGIARGLLKGMERASVASASALTAVSQTQCEYFKVKYGMHCEYIPTAADVKSPADPCLISEMNLEPRGYILFAARLVPEKGAHHLIRAFRRTATEQTLVIAGEAPSAGGYQQELINLAKGDPRIRFIGRVQGRLLEELFSNTSLFVQPSELEGLSIGLIEGMSYGVPCLASDIPENREVVGDIGILFQNKDVDSLERQLNWALSHPEICRERGALSRSRALNLFSWERVVDQLEALYERMLVRIPTYKPDLTPTPAIRTEL